MLAIYKREIRAYFTTVIGFLIVAANLFLISLYFVVYNIFYNYPYFQYAIQGSSLIMFIAIPVLTMRMIAEERRNKTDQLILTAPVSIVKVVLGKYLSALTIFAIPCVISCIYPLIMSRFGTVAFGEGYLSILGFFLYGMACIAIGTFISSLFENQIIAAVVTFAFLFIGYMMSSLCSLISADGNLLTKILGFYDLSTPFNNLANGTLDFSAVIYFTALSVLFLYLTIQSVQKRRYSVSAKHFTFGAYSIIGIVIAVAIFVFINIGVKQIPESYLMIDCTYNNMYTLTEDTKKYVAALDEDINIYVIASENGYDESVAKTLKRYEGLSGHIKVKYVDPNVNPRFYANYTSTAPSSGSLIVESSKRSKVIDYNDLYEQTYNMNYYTYNYDSEVVGYDAEGQITGAIDYVLSDDMPVMYITEGHGEYELEAGYTAALSKANIEYETINLMSADGVPEDAACLLINGPMGDFSDDDLKKVTDYLDRGGKVILTLSLADVELVNINKLAEYMNLGIKQGVVVELDSSHFYGSELYEIPKVYPGEFTSEIYGAGYNLFSPYNTGIILPEEDDGNVVIDVFLETSDSAYLKIDYKNMTDTNMEDGDIPGPFPVGVSATRTTTDAEGNSVDSELVVFSSVTMFSEAADSMVSSANQKVFITTVGLYSNKENAISIPSKSFDLGYLTTTMSDIIVIALVTVIIVPVALIVCGIVIWARRRKM
ncbi:MAG: Gldg family protein [Lachnospiraceae bacterium]|nr:Gldg family protein [Lachnospiraceae bacterium]